MRRTHRDSLGSAMGLLVFLGGVGLLVVTFKLAYDLYTLPPDQALQIKAATTLDFAKTGSSFVGILVRTFLLLVMGLVSSLIANRGILMYSHSLIKVQEIVTATPAPTVEVPE